MKAFVRSRPIRVAYLVEENEHWQSVLDAFFAESFARWGGRFTLIVPCRSGAISPAYIPWLEEYDADLVYSYVDLNDAAIDSFHERFGPAFLVRHNLTLKSSQPHSYRSNLPIEPLSVLSVTAVLARANMIRRPQPVAVVDTQLGTSPSGFLQQTFGCYGQSLTPWPIAQDMSDQLEAVIFVPPEIQADHRIAPRASGRVVSSEKELIDCIASQQNLVGLAQMSASLSPRLALQDMTWSRTINLVVGDSFADRVVFWNAIHYTPAWLDGRVVTLKVSKDDIFDTDRLDAISRIVKKNAYIFRSATMHPMRK